MKTTLIVLTLTEILYLQMHPIVVHLKISIINIFRVLVFARYKEALANTAPVPRVIPVKYG